MSDATASAPSSVNTKNIMLFALVAILFLGTGFVQSWNTALTIFNMGLISCIMALGVNMQWGYAGLFNVGIMGFVALGGLATVLVSVEPVPEAWSAGGLRTLIGLVLGALTIVGAILLWNAMPKGRLRGIAMLIVLIIGFTLFRRVFDVGVDAVESIDPASTGFLGGLGLPVLLAWPVGGLLAAGAAWIIGKTALGLRSDYLAIATLGIAEIIIAILKNEDWLARGVKNVTGIERPVPYEVDLQASDGFLSFATNIGADPVTASTITVKLLYAALFLIVVGLLIWLSEKAWNSPWGRMMRAIRDNEVSASAMGKDVKARHLQIFILGSAICGIAGAMMTTLDSQLVPGTYQPLRFTFLIWVMVIVGGSGNNWGAVLGGFLIWWLWVQVEPLGLLLMQTITAGMDDGYWLREHLLDSAAHMRLLTMGMILLLVLRFSPRGLIPER
ncbi:branched-chain amino acid ABC transporter permease [Jannaschia sp. CCS1]|uniref:branched-chain amino acid ABC transporter permease n=1 Tax=Jannaschia sp. (strain CCS1) TaxID=290400 RepID=UPI000053D95B|nr:branched-chain amino acid ABC transporter permease [Jannaschia sp. CCS1]ABD55074.1 amino acid/amide ABC transporter membrane protein 2, HAAT family [Jannaschia sp. CCS1]